MNGGSQQSSSSEQVGAFLQGVLAGQALAQAQAMALSHAQSAAAGQSEAFKTESGEVVAFGFTDYDSIFWCKSRFACNPQSISCFC